MTHIGDTAAEVACTRLANASYSFMDQGRYEDTVELFTADALWVRGGKPCAGRDAIMASLRQRPTTDLTRHLITNVVITVTSADEASGTACFMPIKGAIRADGTVATPPITNVGDLAFKFRREADGWRISELKPATMFKP